MDLRKTDMLSNFLLQTICHRFRGLILFVNSKVMPKRKRSYVANVRKKKDFLLFLGTGSWTDEMLSVFEQQERTLKKRTIQRGPANTQSFTSMR
jgi:hypothetical protein